MTDDFMRTKMLQLKHLSCSALEPQARISYSCLWEDCIVHHARCWCEFCVHTPSKCRYYVPAIRNCMNCQKKKSLTALRQILKNATTMKSNFLMRNSAMMRTTKTKYAVSLLLFIPFPSCFPINNVVIIFTSVELLTRILTPFVCSDELVCRAALFVPDTRLVVAVILVKHCNLHFVIVLIPISVLHKVFLSCLNHQVKELQMNLRRPSSCSSVR